MTDLLKRAFEAAQSLPEGRQNDLAAYLMILCANAPEEVLPDDLAAMAEAEAELARGEALKPGDVAAFWRRHGL